MTIEQALINIEKELKCQEEARYCENFCYKCPNFVGYDELTDTLRTLSNWVQAENENQMRCRMSGDCMSFPDTVEEFMEQYKVVDKEGIYMSKGAKLVPIFRMEQWFEHEKAQKKGYWIDERTNYCCSECHRGCWVNSNYCPWCGADMGGERNE